MELNYNIKINQLSSDSLEENTHVPSETLDLRVFKTESGMTLKSNSANISDHFTETSKLVKNVKLSSNYILGYDEDSSWGYRERGSFEITEDYLQTFIKGPDRYNLEPISDGKFEKNISDQDTVNLLSFKDGIFKLELLNKFIITFSDFKVRIIEEDLDSIYFLLIFKNNARYEKTTNNLTIATNQFINLSNGFYQVLPSFKKSSYALNSSENFINISSTNPLKLESNLNVSYDNYVSNQFYLSPKFKIQITYGINDYTPLNNIESFDSSCEYVILELVSGLYKPVYYLSSDFEISSDKENYLLLMQSHPEFKKPFFVIANKTSLNIKNPLGDSILDTGVLYNKDFETLKNTNTSVDGNVIPLTKIKI